MTKSLPQKLHEAREYLRKCQQVRAQAKVDAKRFRYDHDSRLELEIAEENEREATKNLHALICERDGAFLTRLVEGR